MSEKRQEREKPEWSQVNVFKDVSGRVSVAVQRLSVKRPTLSFNVAMAGVEDNRMMHFRPKYEVKDDGTVEYDSVADAIAETVRQAEAYIKEVVEKDAKEFKAAQERWAQNGGKGGHKPNNDPKELAKRKRRQENLARRRAEDRARAAHK